LYRPGDLGWKEGRVTEDAVDETLVVRRLRPENVALTPAWRAMFGKAFGEESTYCANPPSHFYVERLLADHSFIAIAATIGAEVVGGAAAYELRKFERERSEIYLYDLAVDERYRRRGIARAMIARLQEIARDIGAWAIFVQADHGDAAAIKLYESYGPREEVLHFDIPPGEV
jgi:aminoglycoside 3-N-acetyltransferase I